MTEKKYTICAFADEAGPSPAEQIRAMKDNGVELLEMRSVNGKNVTELTNEEVRDFRAQLDAAGIGVWAIGSPCGKHQISEPFGPQLDLLKRTIEIAQLAGAGRIRMFSFYGCDTSAAVRDEVMLRLSRYAEAARGSGVLLCHENEKGIYGDIASRCRDILDSVPELGGVYDPANFLQCNQDTLEAWALLHDRIDYFHIKDVKSDGTLVPAGMGAGRLPELLTKYLAQGGRVMTLEPHLKVFSALASLEEQGSRSAVDDHTYADSTSAFRAAADGLKNVLASIGA